jgi:hypothetical protein
MIGYGIIHGIFSSGMVGYGIYSPDFLAIPTNFYENLGTNTAGRKKWSSGKIHANLCNVPPP